MVWSWGLWHVWLDIMGVLSVSVVDLLADLLGEGELDSGAGGGSQLGDALLHGGNGFLDLWDGDTFLSSEVLAGDDWEVNWLVDAGLDWLRVGHGDWGVGLGDDGAVVASLLGDLLAVVVAVLVVSVAGGGLADSDHLGVALPGEGDSDGLGGGGHNLLNVLTAHGAGRRVALLDIPDCGSSGDRIQVHAMVAMQQRVRDGHADADDAEVCGLMRLCAYAEAMRKTQCVCT